MEESFDRNIPFWDYEQSAGFDETHFADTAHLNSSGAAKFSSVLNQKINAFIEVPYVDRSTK